jgi:hypothetical protein
MDKRTKKGKAMFEMMEKLEDQLLISNEAMDIFKEEFIRIQQKTDSHCETFMILATFAFFYFAFCQMLTLYFSQGYFLLK